jgi:hypothetical protein
MPSLFELILKNEGLSPGQASQPVSGIGQFVGEIRAGLRQTSQEWNSFSDSVDERGRRTTEILQSGFEGLFRKSFKGEVSTAKDVFQSFCDFLGAAFAKTVSKMASDLLGSALSSALRGLASTSMGGGFDLAGGVAESVFGCPPRVASSSEALPASVMVALPSPGNRPALGAPSVLGALSASGDFRPAASRQPVTAASGGTPPNIEVRIENHGVDIGQASARTIQMDPEKMVIGIIVKNVNEGGALRQLLGARK